MVESEDSGLHWSSRWGPARINGEADFIPAQGGCVMYLVMNGVGALSHFPPISGLLSRAAERWVKWLQPQVGA